MKNITLSPQMSVSRSITSSGVMYCLNLNGKCFQVYTSLDTLMRDIRAIITGDLQPEVTRNDT